MKRTNKLLALILSVSMLTSAVSAIEIQSTEPQQETSVADTLSKFLLDKIEQAPEDIVAIKESPSETEEQPQRAPAQSNTDSPESAPEPQEPENANNELNLQLVDGSYSFYSFSEDIKFTDENGTVQYKDTTIVPQTDQELIDAGYTYTNGTNDFRINFAPAVDKGVYTEYDGVKIGFIPIPAGADYNQTGDKTTFMLDENSVDSFEYPDLYGEGSILRYTAQLNALKKDIILPEYTGQNEFHFILDTYGNAAALGEDGKTIRILDSETNEILRELAPIYAYDSFGGTYSDDFHYTEDCHYTLSLREDGKYNMGVVVSEEYLSNPELIYPVTIDPSGVSLSNLQDAPVYSLQSSKNWGGSTTMCCGRSSTNGSGRSYIKFNINSISGTTITVTGATLTLRETTGRTTNTAIAAYMADNSWTESGVNWNNKPGYKLRLSSNNINSSGGYFYNFNVRTAVQYWALGYPNYGFAIVSDDESNTRNFWRAFATKEYSNSTYRPVLKVNYNVASVSQIKALATPMQAQQMSKWCWAASGLMAVKTLYTTDRTQSDIVRFVKGSVVDEPANCYELARGAKYASYNNMNFTVSGVLSADAIKQQINKGNAVTVLRGWMNGTIRENGHFIVIYGYEVADNTLRFLIRDPWPVNVGATYKFTYQELCDGRTTGIDTGVLENCVYRS